MTRGWLGVAALAALATATGCSGDTVDLEVRTFELEHIYVPNAAEIVSPYVYTDREGAPGAISTAGQKITIRETADNLDRIARLLAEMDRPPPVAKVAGSVGFHFQLIEANGHAETAPAIADVVAELRKVMRFGGYRLVGEAHVVAAPGSFGQSVITHDGELYDIEGTYGTDWSDDPPRWIRIVFRGHRSARVHETLFNTAVQFRPGQVLVLGTVAEVSSVDPISSDGPQSRILVMRTAASAAYAIDAGGTASASSDLDAANQSP